MVLVNLLPTSFFSCMFDPLVKKSLKTAHARLRLLMQTDQSMGNLQAKQYKLNFHYVFKSMFELQTCFISTISTFKEIISQTD